MHAQVLNHLPCVCLSTRCDGTLQESIRGVRDLFRDASQTEFIIATIPTQLGIAESKRLLAALQEETIPCKRVIVNQVEKHYAAHMCLRGKGGGVEGVGGGGAGELEAWRIGGVGRSVPGGGGRGLEVSSQFGFLARGPPHSSALLRARGRWQRCKRRIPCKRIIAN